jgi:ankyrin repeat protein
MWNVKRGLVVGLLGLLALPVLANPVRDLVVAAQMDNPSTVRKLLASGLSANTVDPVSGEPVILVALREGSNQVVDVLLADKQLDTELRAPNGNTALMMAAFRHNKPAVLALLARGAAVNKPGWSALHYAAASGDTAIAAILLEHGAAIDAMAPSDLTPLMLAAREGQQAVAEQLLRAGANPRLRNGENLTATELAMRADKPAVAAAIDQFQQRKAQ